MQVAIRCGRTTCSTTWSWMKGCGSSIRFGERSHATYSHSIISRDVSSLIWKHNSSRVTDKCRRYTQRNFLILNSQEKLPLTRGWQFRYLSESIDWMARRVRNQDDTARTGTELQIPSEIRKRPLVPAPLLRLLCGSHTGPLRIQELPSPSVRFVTHSDHSVVLAPAIGLDIHDRLV
jgi:hypothetical protein